MRSIVLALAFAAPLSAVAATPNTFTAPTRHSQQAKPEMVFMTIVNRSVQDREVLVDGQMYKVNFGKSVNVSAPVGSTVRVYSQTNSKINGQELMTVSASDRGSNVFLK